jgi:hypothetical protein
VLFFLASGKYKTVNNIPLQLLFLRIIDFIMMVAAEKTTFKDEQSSVSKMEVPREYQKRKLYNAPSVCIFK